MTRRTDMWSSHLRRVVVGIAGPALLLAACGGEGGPSDVAAESTEGTESDAAEEVPAEQADISEKSLKVATVYGPDNWQSAGPQAFAEAIEERSDGKMTVEFHYAAALVEPGEHLEAMRDGVIDFAAHIPAYHPDALPIESWITAYAYQNESVAPLGLLQAGAANIEWSFNTPEHLAEFEAAGVKPLLPRFQQFDEYHLICSGEPFTNLESAEGRTSRAGSGPFAEELQAIGFDVVHTPVPEIYDAMQRGIFDCWQGPIIDMVSNSLHELGDHVTAFGGLPWSSHQLAMSMSTWESLTLDEQRVIWDSLPAFLEGRYGAAIRDTAAAIETVTSASIEFHQAEQNVSDAIGEHRQAQVDAAAERAPSSLDDPDAALQRFVEAHDEWWDLLTTEAGYSPEYETWEDFGAANPDGEFDLQPWLNLVWERLLEPRRP